MMLGANEPLQRMASATLSTASTQSRWRRREAAAAAICYIVHGPPSVFTLDPSVHEKADGCLLDRLPLRLPAYIGPLTCLPLTGPFAPGRSPHRIGSLSLGQGVPAPTYPSIHPSIHPIHRCLPPVLPFLPREAQLLSNLLSRAALLTSIHLALL